MLSLQNLSIGFGARTLLSKVNAVFGTGTLTALIGRNGSGKSTLLRAIAGLNRHYSGQILIDGHSLDKLSTPAMARTVALVTTERIRIGNFRCYDIVAAGRAPYTNWLGRMQQSDRHIVEESLEAVGMLEFADRSIDTLSDGETQRIMIARALAQSTPVMLLDEPTSFLDMPSRYELCEFLADLAHDSRRTILFSTHELDIALDIADTIALIDSPTLTVLPAAEMRDSDALRRLFSPRR